MAAVLFRICLVLSASVATVSITGANGENILTSLFHPLGQPSHNAFVGYITERLRDRNHTITLLTSEANDLRGFSDEASSEVLTFKVPTHKMAAAELQMQTSRSSEVTAGPVAMLNMLVDFMAIAFKDCEDMFDDVALMEDLKKRNFDLLLLEMFVPCDALLAAYLEVPFIVMTSSIRYLQFDEDIFHVEAPSSYVPIQTMSSLTDEMTFWERVRNVIHRYIVGRTVQYLVLRPYEAIKSKYAIRPSHSIRELAGMAELWISQVDFALDFPRPTAPNWIPVGGLITSQSKPLQQDLEEFVQGSGEHGVIVFCLGSSDLSLINNESIEFFTKAFSELPQRVIMRYGNDPPPRNLGNNTRLMKWIPQYDLLSHPKTRLLVYHGGLTGVYEAITKKVPMVLMPLFADQPGIAARVEKKGMGVVLEKTKLSPEIIKAAILKVLTDPSYQSNVDKFSAIHRDAIATPAERAIFWIEHVLKFGGDHLKSKAGDLNFFVLNSLDVIAFLIGAVLLVLYVDYLILRQCCRVLCGKMVKKEKSE